MAITPNMGLTKWSGTDYFSRAALATDWDLVDAHDHTPGKGVQIPTGGIANLAVTSPKIADASVVEAKLASQAVSIAKIKQEAWTVYTPTYSVFNPGTGFQLDARYLRSGNTVWYRGRLKFGTSGTSGQPTSFSVPFTATAGFPASFGIVYAFDDSAATWFSGICQTGTSGVAGVRDTLFLSLTGTGFTFTVNDIIQWQIAYEAS